MKIYVLTLGTLKNRIKLMNWPLEIYCLSHTIPIVFLIRVKSECLLRYRGFLNLGKLPEIQVFLLYLAWSLLWFGHNYKNNIDPPSHYHHYELLYIINVSITMHMSFFKIDLILHPYELQLYLPICTMNLSHIAHKALNDLGPPVPQGRIAVLF